MERNPFVLSKHALDQIKLRGISEEIIWNTLENPDHIVTEEGKKVYQSLVENGGFLIRIFVNYRKTPKLW